MSEWAFVALGSNVGDREAFLELGRKGLAEALRTRVVATTPVEETEPLGPWPQRRYLNQMVLIRTKLSPRELLAECQGIERAAGRVRRRRWGPRTLDLDIVRYGTAGIQEPDLVIPHPELANRPFWQREVGFLEVHTAIGGEVKTGR